MPVDYTEGGLAGKSKNEAKREIRLAMQQAQADYEILKQEHARLLALATDTAGTPDGTLTLARMKKTNRDIHQALDRYHAALQRFASLVLDRPGEE